MVMADIDIMRGRQVVRRNSRLASGRSNSVYNRAASNLCFIQASNKHQAVSDTYNSQ